MKKAIVLTLLLFLSAVLIPINMQSQQSLPSQTIVLSIINHLNYTRTNETVIVTWTNLTTGGMPNNANPDSFRVIDQNGKEVPSQFDDLTAYGYEKYLVFPATVPANSAANYTLYYTTGSWAKPTYTNAVNITETKAAYSITAQNYSATISKTSGAMISLKTRQSGELLSAGTGFDSEVFQGTNWSPNWLQVEITDAQTTLLSEGPVRSIIVTDSALGSSQWNFTTVYLIYKDRIETLTKQIYLGTSASSAIGVRVNTVNSVAWLLGGNIWWDGDNNEAVNQTIHSNTDTYHNAYSEWAGAVFTVRSSQYYKNYNQTIGRWFDLIPSNGSFGYGFIIYNAQNAVRIEDQDMRQYNSSDLAIASLFYQISDSSGAITPVIPNTELWYHWAILPQDNSNYTYIQTETEKAYSPLGLRISAPPPRKSITIPEWLVFVVFFAVVAAVAILFARKLRSKAKA
jgi:hypothetical protein